MTMTMATNETGPVYCGDDVDAFHTGFKIWHGYISLIVCLLGTIANTLNIIVLSRREMRSPTNAILTGLAVADLAVMLEYIPYTIHDYILRLPREHQLTYGWACFVKFHSIFAQVLHTISIWLTVTLAVWRYIAVGYPQRNRIWCGMRTTVITIATAYVVCVLVVSPWLYLISSIAKFLEVLDAEGNTLQSIALSQYLIDLDSGRNNHSLAAQAMRMDPGAGVGNFSAWAFNETTMATPTTSMPTTAMSISTTAMPMTMMSRTSAPPPHGAPFRNVTVYKLYYSSLAIQKPSLLNATFLIYSVLIKLIPCIALTILSVRLIAALLEAKRRRKLLTSNAANGMKAMVNGKAVERPRKNSKTLEKEKQTDRTTRMLLAVLMLFLLTEFPQGILGLMSTILGDPFYSQCYLKMSDVMDIFALINSSINFILYCSMSRQFRSTFTLLFRPRFLDKWLPVAQDEDGAGAGGGRTDNGVSRCGPGGGGGGGGAGGGNFSKGIDQNYLTTQVTNV